MIIKSNNKNISNKKIKNIINYKYIIKLTNAIYLYKICLLLNFEFIY